MSRRRRFAVYGLLGVASEVAFTGLADVRRSRDHRLRAHTTLWSLPIYARWHVHGHARPDWLPLWAGAGLALECVHDRLVARGQ